jgi:hypothetical protein
MAKLGGEVRNLVFARITLSSSYHTPPLLGMLSPRRTEYVSLKTLAIRLAHLVPCDLTASAFAAECPQSNHQ